MKYRATPAAALLPALFLLLQTAPLRAQDVILQGFYWNTHPGDATNTTTGGIWWDTLSAVAPELAAAGFQTVWTPPPTKSFAGVWDMGYGTYDYFDLGDISSKGTTRTRHGSRAELNAMLAALHGNGLKVMADVVLNHRGGADAQAMYQVGGGSGYNVFTPPSTRIPSGPAHVHPNLFHPDNNPDYHNAIFFEDLCYFNENDANPPTNPDGSAGSWFFGMPTLMGSMGDSLIMWGRWLVNDVGYDELRLDAVKHIDPWFIKKFLIESKNAAQPFAVGESFEYGIPNLVNYWSQVEDAANSGGVKTAKISLFDFPLRGVLKSVLNTTNGSVDLYNTLGNAGLVWGSAMGGFDVVTWLESHDTDRQGYINATSGCPIPYGAACLQLHTENDHDPVVSDKEDMGYPFLLAAEGRPVVFWKDWYWYGMADDIKWQIALRAATATGTSDHIQNMAGFWPTGAPYDADNHGGNMFALRRNGLSGGATDGMVLGLNDDDDKEHAVWVNTPFTGKYLKDYSDGYLFQTTQAFGDSRALIKAQKRDYSWWSLTGLYPKPAGTAASHFSMSATPGGCPHFIAICAADAANLIVNGAPIAIGDELAVKNAAGQVVGIGRIGQGFRWDGTHDMIIEALGAPSANGLAGGEAFRIFVYDASAGSEVEIGTVQYAAASTAFIFAPGRPNSPNRNGNFSSFPLTTTAQGLFTCEGISRIIAFNTQVAVNQAFCGSDNAANSAYNSGWTNSTNGGAGFGAWQLSPASNTGNAGFFIGDSRNNGDGNSNGDNDINTAGEAWGMYGNGGNTASAVRPFSAAWPSGAVFSLQMDNGFIDNGNTVGFGLQNGSGQDLLEFYFTGGTSFYQYNDLTNAHNTSVGFTDEGLSLSITLTSATTYQLVVTQLNGGASSTYSGSLKNPGGGQGVQQLRLYNANAGSGGQRDAFFNSIGVCYPATLVINEVDYDQAGADEMEFIELKNVGSTAVNLDNYKLELVDGGGNTVYRTVDLPNVSLAAGDYYVICGNGSGVPNCDFNFDGAVSDRIQNGSPDAVRLVLNNSITVDALSYEGSVTGAVEGTGVATGDNNTTAGVGLSRLPDGNDTDNNNSDFQLTCITPGSANVSNTNSDADTYPDPCDNCPDDTNENQADTDEDAIGDACDDCPLAVDGISNFNTTTCNCEPGYYPATEVRNSQTVITGCQPCPAGSYCPDGVNAIPCPPGSFSSTTGSAVCQSCAINTYSSSGSTACQSCGSGYYSPEGSAVCSECALSFTATPTPESCAGAMDGQIAISNVMGGTAPFQYSIDNGMNYVGTSVFSGLSANTYQVRVTDFYDCESIAQPVTVSISACPIEFSGAILWEHNNAQGINNATVNLSGAGAGSDDTDSNGDYLISIPYVSGNFTLKPVKNSNKLNGVTVADATAIQQHLTNTALITSAYKKVAADVNKSNSISTADATTINQSLLGNPAALAQFKTSWRFVPQAHALVVPPWTFPEQIDLAGVTASQTGQDFFGIKTGDVTSAYANPNTLGAPEASGLVWRVPDQLLQAGEALNVEFSAAAFHDLAAFQFALRFDPGQLAWLDLETLGGLPLMPEHFGLYQLADGEIRVVWSQAQGLELPGAEPVFRLRFQALLDGVRLSEALVLAPDVLPGYAYNSRLEESEVQLAYGTATGATDPAGVAGLQLHVRPNPFRDETVLSFALPEACEAQLRVFDINGRILLQLKNAYPAGNNTEILHLKNRVAPGVLICELVTPFGAAKQRILALR